MSLKDKLLKGSTIKLTSIIDDSKVFNEKDMVPTSIPMLNVALSGRLDGGLGPGLTLFCGKSKHFKSLFTLICMKAYMDQYPDAMALFYDTEFGTPRSYFESLGIDMDRVVHTPITNIEEFKFDVMNHLENNIQRGDKLFMAVDSVGNMASKKEVEDALKGSSAADMTRAKQLKSCFRMITPKLTILDIPMVCVNHIYMTQEMFSKPVVSGGDGIYLSADNIYIIGRQQEKDGSEVSGYHFIINVEKSRHVREKSKIPVTVLHNGGLDKWSGLLDVALDGGFLAKPKQGWYCMVDQETGELGEKNFRAKDAAGKDFWLPIVTSAKFKAYIEGRYLVANDELITTEE
jgi:RecA/RadA recombinase